MPSLRSYTTLLSRLLAPALLAVLAAGCAYSAQAQRESTRPGGIRAYGFPTRIGAPQALVRVSWDRPSRVPSSYVLQYVIWRSDPLSPYRAWAHCRGIAATPSWITSNRGR